MVMILQRPNTGKIYRELFYIFRLKNCRRMHLPRSMSSLSWMHNGFLNPSFPKIDLLYYKCVKSRLVKLFLTSS